MNSLVISFSRQLRAFWNQLKLGEMRLAWAFSGLALILFIINIFYLPSFWLWVGGFVTIFFIGFAFWRSLRLVQAKSDAKTALFRLEAVVADLNDGVIAYDKDFKILTFNSAAEKIFGVSRPEVIGKYFGPERAREERFRLLTQTLFPSLAPLALPRSPADSHPQIVDISFTEPERELRVLTNKVTGPQGEAEGFIKLVRDRTREIQLLKTKSEFVTIAAHQLRTPLTTLHWVLEGLTNKEKLESEDKELILSGLDASVKLLKIINDLLDVSKIEEGRFGYNFIPINLIDFLTKLLANAEAMAKKNEVNLYFDRGNESAIDLTIDPDRFGLALSNLLDNAIKYNVKNGSVTVKVERLPNTPYLQISVKDTGVGIPKEDMPKLFSKFFRAENAMRLRTEGSGLGLYIAKNIINRHGGTVWAESIVGRGTTIFFTLPLDPKLIPPKEFPVLSE